jgi:integrase
MTIFKRGKVYWFHFLHDGQHVQQSTRQGNRNTARQIEAAYRTALAKGDVGITERKAIPGFKSAMDDFLEWSRIEHSGRRIATYKRYRTSSVALLKHFNNTSLDKITPDEVEKFKKARMEQFATKRGKNKRVPTTKRIKPATVNRELACLRVMFNHSIKAEVPVKNPVCSTGARALPENNEKNRVLTYDEQEKYLAHASPMLFDVASIILETGMRPEEVCRIRPENVNLDQNYLFNPFGKTKAAKRRIKLTATVKNILAVRMAACTGAYLFPHDDDPNRPVPKLKRMSRA